MTALLIDLDGVLYEGDSPVPGAAEAIDWVQRNAIQHLFVTNTTSRPRKSIVEKLAAFGVRTDENKILTPPVAAASWLAEHVSGPVALFVARATITEFSSLKLAGHDQQQVASVVIGDYGESWNFGELNRAFRLLMQEPQPILVALGMTRYWLADDGLRLDTAPFVTALAHASGAEPVVLGKPAMPFFTSALATLGVAPEQTFMIGDDIKGDIGGAQSAGLGGLLVRTGKFRDRDFDGDVRPEFVLDSIAQLPARWGEIDT